MATKPTAGLNESEVAMVGVEALIAALITKGVLTSADVDAAFVNAVAAPIAAMKKHAVRHNRV